ncbi:MAG: hypothetical protein ACTSP4_12000 [Candidatus Hodarchaeales archaeon]
MKRFGSTTISLVFISFLIILSLSTDFALAAQNNNISGLDSDGDGISDLVEEYYRRNISITTTSMSAVINSNWTRPASEEYNLERPFNCLFPGTSGNTVQTRISTDNGLSIDYLLGLVHIWGNLTSFNEKFRMTVRFTSIVEFKDINNNNVFDFNDQILSEFCTNSTGYDFYISSPVVDGEVVLLVNTSSDDFNSTVNLVMMFSERFFRLPNENVIASPINDYAFLNVKYPNKASDSNLFVKIEYDWQNGSEYCTRPNEPVVEAAWDYNISSSDFKPGYDSMIITETYFWNYIAMLFSWSDSAVNNSKIMTNFKLNDEINVTASDFKGDASLLNRIRLTSMYLFYNKSNVIEQGIQFGLLKYLDTLGMYGNPDNVSINLNGYMIIIATISIYLVKKRQRKLRI